MIKQTSLFNKQLFFSLCALMYCATSTAMDGREYENTLHLVQCIFKQLINNNDQQSIKEQLRTTINTNWNNIVIDPATGNNIFHIAASTLPLVWVYGSSEHPYGIQKVKNKAGQTPFDIKAAAYAQYYAKNPIKKTVLFKK